ncbi:hypothetical protein [Brevibacterium sp. HMSC22B09]|uniref:hypothetical protein n=1 Tax=Brevibacterium sp. HMSC22B09 TaxID=1581055 RepID=UPI0008A628E9|nr:hypothetical protein [Brevibacterium sp. HMSC22B09]OFT96540.1 hypothetical protein HMPREF3087_07475 [Brevibacterium sp. HMSC22B09]
MKKSADNTKVLYGRMAAGLAAAASTAVGTVVIVGLSLVARATSGSSGLWWMFGVLTSSFAVLGGIATVGAFLTGLVRAGYVADSGKPARWSAMTALFIAFATPVILYVFTGPWLTNGLIVAVSTFLCSAVGALIFLLVWPLLLRAGTVTSIDV